MATGATAIERDRRKVPHRIIRQAFVKRGIDGLRSDCRHQQRPAIGRRLGHRVGANGAARASSIIDHERRLECVAKRLGERPRNNIGRSPGWKRHDHTNLCARQALRSRDYNSRK